MLNGSSSSTVIDSILFLDDGDGGDALTLLLLSCI